MMDHEDAIRAGRMMKEAAEGARQAALNFDGSVDRLQMLWERQIYPDFCNLLDRLEKLSE